MLPTSGKSVCVCGGGGVKVVMGGGEEGYLFV